MMCRFPGGWSNLQIECPDSVDWYIETLLKAKADPRISDIFHWRRGDTPVPMLRNLAVEAAQLYGVDLLLIMDSDMNPDAYLHTNSRKIGIEPAAKAFWESSLEFVLSSKEPCVVAAPYCGPGRYQNVYVFQWSTLRNDDSASNLKLEMFTREEAARRGGIEEVAAVPTGLCLIDMRIFRNLPVPYFYYEWNGDGLKCEVCKQRKPGKQTQKASTEDVTWSRDISLLWRATKGRMGGRIYCNWDAWAGHWKMQCIEKPELLTTDGVGDRYREAILSGRRIDEVLVDVGSGKDWFNDPNNLGPLVDGEASREKITQ
jgi:hypothetical protein